MIGAGPRPTLGHSAADTLPARGGEHDRPSRIVCLLIALRHLPAEPGFVEARSRAELDRKAIRYLRQQRGRRWVRELHLSVAAPLDPLRREAFRPRLTRKVGLRGRSFRLLAA